MKVMMPIQMKEEETSDNANRECDLEIFKRITDANQGASPVFTRQNMCGSASSMSVEMATEKANNKNDEAYYTAKPAMPFQKDDVLTKTKKHQSAKQIADLTKNLSALRPKTRSQASPVTGIDPARAKKNVNAKSSSARTSSSALENQPAMRQKLDRGRSRQILNVVELPQQLPHKSKLGLAGNCDGGSFAVNQIHKRKPYLTAPKTPVLQTSMRLQSTTLKSSLELELIPKFKARPLNKKIFESKGEMGLLYRAKKEVTIPEEFHFATNDRLRLPTAAADSVGEVAFSKKQEKAKSQCNAEARESMEKEEAKMRTFKAKPILKNETIPVLERARKPLRQVEQFNLRTDIRVAKRAKFDQMLTKKEMFYKKDGEAASIEEETTWKKLSGMVPHSRSVPNFTNPFSPHKSKVRATPNLRVLQRTERGKVVNAAVSSMR